MKSFLSRFRPFIAFVLTGFDRLRFGGESRLLNHASGVQSYCYQRRVPFKDFPAHARALTGQFVAHTKDNLGDVPLKYLDSPKIDKDAVAQQLAREHNRTQGRIAVIACLESGQTYRVRRNHDKLIDIRKEPTRCLHYYHYFLHEQLGRCYVRIQSWFPFTVHVGINGRLWLAQQLHNRGVACQRLGNLITAVDDVPLAQKLLDEQPHADWPKLLGDLVRPVHGLWDYLHHTVNTPFYWMTQQSEWASDFIFHARAQLAELYPRFLRHGIETLSCKDVMRFLGKKVPANGYGGCTKEATIDLRERAEGTRLKFWYDANSLKIYDKEGISLRPECTINNTKGFKVFRAKEGQADDGVRSWQHMRKGVADLARRAEVSQAANNRLLDSLATIEQSTSLGELLKPLARPVLKDGKRVARALNPLAGADGELIRALAHGDYLINGFRNRDVRALLHGETKDPEQRRRQAAQITRQLALLRNHGLIKKVPKSHRYHLTAQGQRIASALLAAHAADIKRLSIQT